MPTQPPTPLTPMDGPAPAAGDAAPRRPAWEPWRVLRANAPRLAVVFVAGLLVGLVLWAAMRAICPEYSTTAQLFVSGGVNAYDTPRPVGVPADTRTEVLSQVIANQIVLLRSDDVLSEATGRQGIAGTAWLASVGGEDAARLALRGSLTAAPVRGSTFIAVTLRGRESAGLPQVLDTVIQTYLDRAADLNHVQSTGVIEKFRAQRDAAARRLGELREKLGKFTAEHDLPSLDGRENEASLAYEAAATDLARVRVMRDQAQRARDALRAAPDSAAPAADELAQIEADPAVRARTERLRQLREQRGSLLDRFGENHRAVQETDQQAAAVELERRREIERLLTERRAVRAEQTDRALASLDAQADAIKQRLDAARAESRKVNQQLADYRAMAAAAELAELERQRFDELIRATAFRDDRPDNVGARLLLRASPAELVFPRLGATTFGSAILLTTLAAAAMLWLDSSDERLRSAADASGMLGVPVLASIPDMSDDPNAIVPMHAAVRDDPGGLIAESFRQLRTNVLSALDAREMRTLIVTGPQPGSGASTVAVNLAASLAAGGRRVLLIDADFRKPCLHRLLDAPASPGLAEILTGNASLLEAVQHPDTPANLKLGGVPRLGVIPAGNDGRPELLESLVLARLLRELAPEYDMVILDTPPALLAHEATMLARLADAVLIVARASRDKHGAAARVLRMFENRKARVLGLALNAVRANPGGYLRGNYDLFYRYRSA